MKNLITYVKRVDEWLDIPNWLTIILGVVIILRIPSFFEPYSYGDEMIYLTLGNGIRHGLALYKQIHDNKPPIIYLLAALAGSLFWFKVILAGLNLTGIVIFQKLSKVLFPKNLKVVKIATWVFAFLTTLPLFEGNIVNSELLMIPFSMLAFLILLTKKDTFLNLFFAGLLFSIATLFKIPAAFEVPVIIAYWLVSSDLNFDSIKKVAKNTVFLSLGFLLPILLTFVWFYFKGALNEYLQAAFLQNVGYLSSFRPGDVRKPFLERNLPLLVRGFVVLISSLILYLKRRSLSKTFIFTTLWLLFTLFAVTLSERPYPHYFIQAVPGVSLLVAIMLGQKNMEQVLSIIPLSLAFFVPVYFHFYYYPTLPYYEKFINFAIHKSSKEQYFSTFGGNVNRNYQIADFLVKSTHPYEKVFVWEESETIYALSRRLPPIKYVAGYHIKDFYSKEELAKALIQEKPTTIVLLPESESFPEILPLLNKNYTKLILFQDSLVFRLKQ